VKDTQLNLTPVTCRPAGDATQHLCTQV